MFSGLTPRVITYNGENLSGGTPGDRVFMSVAKFPETATITDFFGICEVATSTNTSTTHLRLVFRDGGTTGDGTTAIGTISNTWVILQQRTRSTNYTLAANEWLQVAWSEAGTVPDGYQGACVWVVAGNI